MMSGSFVRVFWVAIANSCMRLLVKPKACLSKVSLNSTADNRNKIRRLCTYVKYRTQAYVSLLKRSERTSICDMFCKKRGQADRNTETNFSAG